MRIVRTYQQVLNPSPLNPTPATCHKRKRKLHCNFRKVALQKLHCNTRYSEVRTSFLPKAALQQANKCSATLKKPRCKKVALSCCFPADFKPPRLCTHLQDLLNLRKRQNTHTPNFALAMLIVDFVGVVRGFRGLIDRMHIKGVMRQHRRALRRVLEIAVQKVLRRVL